MSLQYKRISDSYESIIERATSANRNNQAPYQVGSALSTNFLSTLQAEWIASSTYVMNLKHLLPRSFDIKFNVPSASKSTSLLMNLPLVVLFERRECSSISGDGQSDEFAIVQSRVDFNLSGFSEGVWFTVDAESELGEWRSHQPTGWPVNVRGDRTTYL